MSRGPRRPPARRPAGRPARKRAGIWRRATSGDRPLIAGLLVIVGLMVALAANPLQSYTAAADRVEDLSLSRDKLSEEVSRLEERRDRLQDPQHLELLAREELGMVRPGEIPFVVVAPEPEFEPAEPEMAETPERGDESLWQRVRRAFAHLLDQTGR